MQYFNKIDIFNKHRRHKELYTKLFLKFSINELN